MALAATGDKTYAKKFRELIRFEADGEFSINRDLIGYHTHGLNRPFTPAICRGVWPATREGRAACRPPSRSRVRAPAHRGGNHPSRRPRTVETAQEPQSLLVRRCRAELRGQCPDPSRHGLSRRLGAALRLDSGAPLGSTLWHHHQTLGKPRSLADPRLSRAWLRRAEIAGAFRQAGLAHERLPKPELVQQVARDLAAGKIVGWFQGRSEVGPAPWAIARSSPTRGTRP